MAHRIISNQVAAGTAVSNTVTETALSTYSFPANFFQPGKVVKFECAGIATSTNSTDTLTIKANFGGTAIATSSAIDAANNDIFALRGTIVCRDADSSGTVAYSVYLNDPDAAGQGVEAYAGTVSSLNFTAAITLEVTATWSVASASNSVRSDLFLIEELTD